MAITRDRAHELLDAVPDDRLDDAAAALESLVDPMLLVLMSAPEDDEPLTDEDREAIAEGIAEYRRGEFIRADEAKRRHGIA